jgi:hypothetical protein
MICLNFIFIIITTSAGVGADVLLTAAVGFII